MPKYHWAVGTPAVCLEHGVIQAYDEVQALQIVREIVRPTIQRVLDDDVLFTFRPG